MGFESKTKMAITKAGHFFLHNPTDFYWITDCLLSIGSISDYVEMKLFGLEKMSLTSKFWDRWV